jgi:hypothetical protein
MDDKKVVLHISHNIPYSRAEFFAALTAFKDAGIEIVQVDKEHQQIWTKNVYVRFMTRHCHISGYHVEEIFGIRNQFNECFLKDKNKPRYSGSLVEYVKKLEENAVTDAFLESELEKLRARK